MLTIKRYFENMAKLSFNSIVPLLAEPLPTDGVLNLLREIIVLQAKLNNIDDQDFYFQMGKKAHQGRLDKMKSEYSHIVELVNNNAVEYFLDQIKEAEETFRCFCSRESNHSVFVKVMVDDRTRSQISYFKMLLQAKGQYKKLKTLDELMQDENALIEIFE